MLECLPFFSGYGVETGLLIDVFERCGLSAIAQVDLLERIHHNQTLEALSKMSFVILQAFFRKLEKRFGRPFVEDVNKSMKLVRHSAQLGKLLLAALSTLDTRHSSLTVTPRGLGLLVGLDLCLLNGAPATSPFPMMG